MKKSTIVITILVFLTLLVFFVHGRKQKNHMISNGKLNVIVTIFPQYDFLREIAGDKINLKMLLKPGSESHSFEPSPQDIISIKNSDVFIYVGGESDKWVDKILESIDTKDKKIISLMSLVNAVKEETVEGMQEEDEEESDEIEYDEHVWTSPKNAQKIVAAISKVLQELDPENAGFYKENTSSYLKKLNILDNSFKEIVEKSKRKTIVFGDRFPFRYFADEYGLKYYAAFAGCSNETECSAATVAFLIDKVKAEKIPVVFYIEFSNEKIADIICESTKAKKLLLHSAHNVSKADFERGITYLDIMKMNSKNLEEALCH